MAQQVEGTYGLLAEFDTPSELVAAAKAAYDSGWRRLDCYTPYPVEEAAEAIGFHTNRVSLVCLVGGLLGLAAMFGLETWVSVLGISLEYWWPSLLLMAGVYCSGVRMDDSIRGTIGCVRHACNERAAFAISPALQRAEFP